MSTRRMQDSLILRKGLHVAFLLAFVLNFVLVILVP